MRILVTADWHIGVTSFGVIDSDGVNSRLKDIEETIDRIVHIACERKVDLVVQCGDVFHTNRPTPREQLTFLNFMVALDQNAIPARVIIGNHDYNTQLGKGHALKLFKEIGSPFVKIIDQTEWEMIDGCLFCWYPYAGEQPDFENIPHQWQFPKRKFLVCHSHLEGAVVGAEPFEIKDDKATKFSDLDVDGVLAGHFHKPQVLSRKPLAFYPGSIQAVDFNERNDVKGVVILDTESLEYEPVGIKTRRLVQIDTSDINLHLDSHGDALPDSIVKVNVKLNESEAHKFDETQIRSQLVSAGVHSIASINLDIEREQVKRDPEIKIDSDVQSNFIRYVEQKDFGDLKDDVINAGKEIIRECAS